jgi:CRP-like cAMP-binding protein
MSFESLFDYDGTAQAPANDELVFLPHAEQELYIVTRGRLEVLVGDERDWKRVAIIEPGSVFGEQSFVDGKPRSASVRALSDGEIRALSLESFEVLAAKDAPLMRAVVFDLARILSLRLRQTTARVQSLRGLA